MQHSSSDAGESIRKQKCFQRFPAAITPLYNQLQQRNPLVSIPHTQGGLSSLRKGQRMQNSNSDAVEMCEDRGIDIQRLSSPNDSLAQPSTNPARSGVISTSRKWHLNTMEYSSSDAREGIRMQVLPEASSCKSLPYTTNYNNKKPPGINPPSLGRIFNLRKGQQNGIQQLGHGDRNAYTCRHIQTLSSSESLPYTANYSNEIAGCQSFALREDSHLTEGPTECNTSAARTRR